MQTKSNEYFAARPFIVAVVALVFCVANKSRSMEENFGEARRFAGFLDREVNQ